eukprot:GHVP01002007.1.p1 GENE.GHVP01002007.1~~GHVP01002007.1.p1  ORF type:complete len:224 (-),score=35.21 GHVP01002007.1:100-771(-)
MNGSDRISFDGRIYRILSFSKKLNSLWLTNGSDQISAFILTKKEKISCRESFTGPAPESLIILDNFIECESTMCKTKYLKVNTCIEINKESKRYDEYMKKYNLHKKQREMKSYMKLQVTKNTTLTKKTKKKENTENDLFSDDFDLMEETEQEKSINKKLSDNSREDISMELKDSNKSSQEIYSAGSILKRKPNYNEIKSDSPYKSRNKAYKGSSYKQKILKKR